MTKPRERAIVYTRFSPRRNSDTSESCETQQAYCEQYAHKKNMDIAEVFADKAVSGKEADRPKLWAAVEALGKGDVLLVYKRDRLARDVYLSECIRRAVERLGGRIVAVEGDIDGQGPEITMIRQVLASVAEYERKVIAIRTRHAMKHHQKNGRRMGRYAPYGTMIDPDDATKLIPDPAELPAVNTIVGMRNQGLSLHEMVVFMNADCKEYSRGGSVWSQRTIKRILERV